MAYYLNTEALRVVKRDERGRVIYRKRFKKGQEVDTSEMEDFRVQQLVEKGTLVESEDDVDGAADAGDTSPVSPPFGAEAGDAGEATAAGQQASTDGEDVDEYSSMDYATLQKTAKDRNLNAGGSADDLRARLREDDASSDDE